MLLTLCLLGGAALAGGGARVATSVTLDGTGCRPALGLVVLGVTPDAAASIQMARLLTADQAARQGAVNPAAVDWAAVARADETRRAQTLALLRAGRLSSAQDFFGAALIFQHGDCPQHFQLAHLLAARAFALGGVKSAGWLTAATYDRWQMSLGRLQTYGTQFVEVGPCDIQLAPVAPGTTDRERERLGVPALVLARAQADIMSARCRGELP
ncbi:hypothetical protein K7W42_21075 [Deinococcus sp. HMF7604]|uniref:hypothetical protein n=1 Tax=Deinococcus betulae TaxID=2873312 RepID=UPI001CCB3202|nr:hypothetical protein [Deinococcus betulae]MBZ9753331.1 hypothetical protein [Deinococcus betulae]